MFERILITGATGSIGSCLVEQLIQDKELQLLTRSHEKAREFRARGIRTFVGDFDEPTTLYPALAGVEKLFLLSGADPRQVAHQGNMIKAAQEMGIRHLVKLSSPSGDLRDLPYPPGGGIIHLRTEGEDV